MHRGSYTAKVGDPIWLIETTVEYNYPNKTNTTVATKTFTSEAGFKSGLRAVKLDQKRRGGYMGTLTYKVFKLEQPTWEQFDA